MSESIEAKELQLVSIFDDSYRFEVPEYQRPYSWTTEQTGELLDDILHAMGKVEEVHDAPPYFLGSIVIIKKGLRPQAQIVDGQQRIATLTILFCVLRELAAESDKSSIDRYVYEPGDKFAGIQGHYRLSVRGRDNSFFRDNIQERGKLSAAVKRPLTGLPDSQRGMVQNAGYLMEALAKLDERRRDTLMQFLVQRCYLVVVSTSDRNSAYRIFSVLNDRGLDLSPTDILKADIIGSLPKDSRAHNRAVWEEIEEDLGRERFRDLFAHIRMISMKSKPQGTLQQEFQEHVLKEVDREAFIEKVLEPYAGAYVTVTGASYQRAGGSGEVNRYLRFLNRLDNFDWIPPAMAFFRRHESDPDAIFGFVRDLERLAYKMFIMRENINRRIQRYRSVLHSIQRREDLSAARSPLQLDPEEKAVLLRVLDGPIYTRPRVPRVLLLRLDTLLAEAGASYEHPIITIEHVLPQNPKRGSQWYKDFPDEEERTEWTHRLANLVLLSRIKNTGASNYEFDYKKGEYFQKGGAAAFVLAASVRDESEWTPAVLARRQRKLIDVLKKEWRLEGETSPRPREVRPERRVVVRSAYEQTRQLLQQGLTLKQAARQLGVPMSTVLGRLEQSLQEWGEIDLRGLLPPERFERIRPVLERTNSVQLAPAKEILGDDYANEEIRVVWLYLRQLGRTNRRGRLTATDRQGERVADRPAPRPPVQGTIEGEDQADAPAAPQRQKEESRPRRRHPRKDQTTVGTGPVH